MLDLLRTPKTRTGLYAAANKSHGVTLECVDCDEPIKPARLAMGKIRCVDCQSRRERLQRLRA